MIKFLTVSITVNFYYYYYNRIRLPRFEHLTIINTVQYKAQFSVTVSRAHSSFVLSENRAEKLGGFKRVLRILYKLMNYMNVPLKVLTVFRNDSMAFCFPLRSM